MPTRPQWFQQLAPALETLRAAAALLVGRAGLEKGFGINPVPTRPRMSRFGGYQTGKTFLIGREDLIGALEAVQTDEAFAYESRRPSA